MPAMQSSRAVCFIFILVALLLVTKEGSSSRPSRRSIQNLAQLAFAHGVRVQAEGSCKVPKPSIVYVQTTNPSKVYLPRGTILHRCSDETGCCPDPTESCQPVAKEEVSLHFITYTLTPSNSHPHGHGHSRSGHRRGSNSGGKRQSFERLDFTNHTLCGCRSVLDDKDEGISADSSLALGVDDDLNEV